MTTKARGSDARVAQGHAWVTVGALLLAASGACNAMTGADGLSLGEQDLRASDTTGETAGTGDTTGTGATGGGGAGPGGGGGGAASNACPYPASPYGKAEGKTVSGALKWQGYAEGATEPSTVAISDYYDCDGSKGINAILLDTSAEWCGACIQEAGDLQKEMPAWKEKGIRVITLMIEDASRVKATVKLADKWRTKFKIGDTVAVVSDPNGTFLPMGSVGLPLQAIVDPRTMTITKVLQGYGGPMPELLALAAKNAKP